MDQNRFHEKSYHKAKTVRMLFRHEMFEKNRKTGSLSYLSHYDVETRQVIQQSLEGPLPATLPPPSQVVRSTISYYRRMGIPIYKTRQQPTDQLDPHMTYQSLWSLAGVQNINKYEKSQQIIKEFQQNFNQYLASPYKQVKQAAIIAAGNCILGKTEDVLKVVSQSDSYLWLLINHVYQSKIDYKNLFKYLPKNSDIVYRSMYEMTNNQKHEIVYSIIENQQVLTTIINAFSCGNEQVQKLAIRIVGNILGQAEDYAGDITKYKILQKIYPRLVSNQAELRKDALWLLANYAYENAGAQQIFHKQILMQRILTLFRYEAKTDVRYQTYYLISHLIQNGNRAGMYKVAIQERFLEQASTDIEIQDQELVYVILNLIQKLIDLGDEFIDHDSDQEQQNMNPFIREIKNTNLSSQIMSKTYSQNQQISTISINILDKVDAQQNQFGSCKI